MFPRSRPINGTEKKLSRFGPDFNFGLTYQQLEIYLKLRHISAIHEHKKAACSHVEQVAFLPLLRIFLLLFSNPYQSIPSQL